MKDFNFKLLNYSQRITPKEESTHKNLPSIYILLRNILEDSGDSMISYTIIRHSRKFLNLLDPSTNFF